MQPCLSYLSQRQGTTLGTQRGENATWPFHSYFVRCAAAPRLSSGEAGGGGEWLNRLHHGIAGVVTWCSPTLLLPPTIRSNTATAVSVTWNPFSAPSLPPARCQLIFCARSTFKALNIIHYNAVHSRLPALLLAECGKCRIRTLLSPLCFWPGGSRSHVLKSRGMYS